MKGIVQKIWGTVVLVFSKWKILSAYIVFSALVLNGWYLDIVGLFSSQDNYAGTFRAQHGDINNYNVLCFLYRYGFLYFIDVVRLYADETR